MAQPVMHFELIAKDTKKLRDFYTKLFGWRPEDYPGMDYAMLHSDAKSGINGGLGSEQTGLPPGMTIYVQVEDVEKFLAQAKKLGAAKVLQEPYDIPQVGRFAVFTDPEGNRIGLWKLPTA
jgi:predicted enzyme related to lactoylglutathione lyase